MAYGPLPCTGQEYAMHPPLRRHPVACQHQDEPEYAPCGIFGRPSAALLDRAARGMERFLRTAGLHDLDRMDDLDAEDIVNAEGRPMTVRLAYIRPTCGGRELPINPGNLEVIQ